MPYRTKMSDWKKNKAKEMRKKPTRAEERLWDFLHYRKLDGLKFRQQAPMLGYIVDFYCPAIKLVVEVDGSIHEKQIEKDQARDDFITKCGMRVLRVKNEEVFYEIENVLDKIRGVRGRL